MAAQGGIFARWQAIGCGVTPREFDRLSRSSGPWIKVRYGVYTTRARWCALPSEGRKLLKDRAALLVCADDAVLSHTSAARALGLPRYGVEDSLVHVTRTVETQAGRIQADIKHHEATLEPHEVAELDGMRLTTPERTAADMAREFGFVTGLVTADAALFRGADRAVLATIAERMTDWKGGPTVSAVAEAAESRAQTPIETLGRLTLLNMGIDDLELQYVVPFPGGRAVCDLYATSLNHVFECDGRIKYDEQYDQYGNLIRPSDVIWLEKKREDKVRGEGYGFSRMNWSDVQPDSFERTSTRLWREIEQQSARHSRTLPPSA